MKKLAGLLLITALVTWAATSAMAVSSYKSAFLTKYPTKSATTLNSCTLCHTGSPSGSNVNSYGDDYANNNNNFTAIENMDSDGDGYTNIAEINANTWPGNASSFPAAADTTAPVVSTFTLPANSASLTVSITALTATDVVGVTGYMVTESSSAPAAGAAGWSGSAPASYTFAGGTANGLKTLYAWAKDAAGNVSTSRSATVTINLPDTTAPVVSTFSLPANSASLTVAIGAFTATDNVGVTGYLITATATAPAAGAAGWSGTAPVSYVFANGTANGLKTLYAWVKDAAGNVSLAKSATVTINVGVTSSAKADFNADGSQDLVFRNTANGMNVVWYMNGVNRIGSGTLPGLADQNWTIAGIDDFNGDGKPDLLWRNTANDMNVIWYMDGMTRLGSDTLPSAAAAWAIVGTGDFNNDGNADIVFRNTANGMNVVWFMNGALRIGSGTLPALADQNWTIAGIDDFNGDGKPDLLWRNTANDMNVVWYMDGMTRLGSDTLPSAAAAWAIVGTGDFNNDGNADIVFRNTANGMNVVWFMNGALRIGSGTLPALADQNWTIAGN